MKKTITKVLASLILLVLLVIKFNVSYGQTTIFTETMGTVGATTTIAVHEAANGFDNDVYTMTAGGATNPGDIRATTPSVGYAGASGLANVWLTSTNAQYGFAIEGIDASTYTSLSLSYGYNKSSATVHATFSVDYWDGIAWITIANTSAALFNEAANAATGWYLAKTLSLPVGAQISGLKIRFSKTGTTGIRVDDVKLTGYPEPTIQTSGIIYSNITTSGMQIDWTNGNGSSRAVFVKETAGAIINPSDGSAYTASADWSAKGTQLGTSGYYCVYDGLGTSVTLTNLLAGTTYAVQAFEYNGAGSSSNYLTTTDVNNPNSQLTVPASPIATAETNLGARGFTATWNAVTGATGYYLDVASDAGFITMINNGGVGNEAVGNVLSKAVTGLSALTPYHYRVRAYGASLTSSNSNTISPITLDDAIGWDNLQFPPSINMIYGDAQTNVYSQVYVAGVTDAPGQGLGIKAWIGVNSADVDPSTWNESAWTLATYNIDNGSNDEYVASIGNGINVGTHYFASRFQRNNGTFYFGGYTGGGGNFWGTGGAVSNPITINQLGITVTANAAQSKVYGTSDPTFTFSNAPALIGSDVFSGSLSRLVGENVGIYPITQGTLDAGTNYNISFVSDNFTITKANQTITFGLLANKVVGNADYNPGATASSALIVSYASSDPSVATIVGSQIHIVGAGTTNITASQSGSANYNPALDVVQPLTVVAPTSTISHAGLTETNLNGAVVSITLANETFADGILDVSNFVLVNAVTNLGIASVNYLTSTTAEITLLFNQTDFDADVNNFHLLIFGTELTSGNPLNSNNLTLIAVTDDDYWTGASNAFWAFGTNWSNGTIPDATQDAIINNVPNLPWVNNPGAGNICKNLIINAGASLSFTPVKDLYVHGNITNNGIASFSSAGKIIFAGTAQDINGTTEFNDITVNPGATVTITGAKAVSSQKIGGILLCNGTINTNDKLTLLSKATGTALIDGSGTGTINGKITMQRYMANGIGYKHVSTPMTDATINEFTDNMTVNLGTTATVPFPTFYLYNEANASTDINIGWDNAGPVLGTSTVMPAMLGYSANFGAVVAPKTFDIFGTPNNGAKSIAVTNTVSGTPTSDGWNLVGNPYPSPINWDAAGGWTKTNVNNGIYFFIADGQYSGSYASYVNSIGSNGGNNIIPSMHGFWIKASANGTLGVDNNVRTADLNPTSYKNTQAINPILRLTATNSSNATDETVIYFEPNATAGFDGNYDAYKMWNTSVTPNFFSITGSDNLSINAQPELVSETIVPLGFYNAPGTYTINASEISNFGTDVKIYLEDVAQGLTTDLNVQPTFSFTLAQNEPNNRFFIRFVKATATGINTADNNGLVYISSNNKNVNVSYNGKEKATVEIYNMLGQPVIAASTIESGVHSFNVNNATGYYTVRVITNGKAYTQKVFVK